MQAGDELLGTVFNKDHRYLVPIFQRPYVWNCDDNWQPLWDDIRQAAEDAEIEADKGTPEIPREYFLGALVTQERPAVPKRTNTSMVIDGQQRLTTMQVFLAAVQRVADSMNAADAGEQFGALTRNRVARDTQFREDQFKVLPLSADRETFEWAMRPATDTSPPPIVGHRLAEAAVWFESAVADWLREAPSVAERLDWLNFAIVNRIKVVSIFLGKSDDPQVIFEALNHRGISLNAADLVKNVLFQAVESQGDAELQEELHDKHWRVLDGQEWRKAVITGRIERARIDALIAYWLSVRRGEESSVEHLFTDVKRWLKESGARAADVIKDIRLYADTMDRLQNLGLDHPVGRVVDRLQANRQTTPWPLLLFLYATPAIPAAQADRGALALDSYLMRRAMCRMATKDYNRMFGAILGVLGKSNLELAGEVLESALAEQTAETRRWPTDHDMVEALRQTDIYNAVVRARLTSFLLGIDAFIRNTKSDPVLLKSATLTTLSVEHVMPQKWVNNWALPNDASEEEIEIRDRHVGMLGNLTLTTKSLNSSMRDGAWPAKKDALQRFSMLPLTTNSILAPPQWSKISHEEWVSDWNETRIKERTGWMIFVAIDAWPRPPQVEQVLDRRQGDQ